MPKLLLTKRNIDSKKHVPPVTDKRDKQAIPCVEYLVTASEETMKGIDPAAYLDDALKWIKAKHGADNVVCSVVHHDEKTPHLVAYVVPVAQVAEKIRKRSVNVKGSRFGRQLIDEVVPAHTLLSAKAYFGGKDKLSKLQTDFHEAVGVRHGLERGVNRTDRRHVKPAEWYAKGQVRLEIEMKGLEALRADFDATRVKLNTQGDQLDKDRLRLNAVEAGLRQRKKGLNQREIAVVGTEDWAKQLNKLNADLKVKEADIAEDYQRLEKITIQQVNLKAGLDQREKVLQDRVAAIDRREEIVESGVTAKLEDLNAHIAGFNGDRAAFRKALVAFQDMTKGYTPGQIVEGIKTLEKTNVKPQVRGR